MNMQHRSLSGVFLDALGDVRYDDRFRDIAEDNLRAATLRARSDSRWFVLRVAYGRETSVEKSLVAIGIEAMVPVRKGPEYRRRGRIIPPSLLPVMTGYVLVRCLHSHEAMLGLKAVEHVVDVLGTCERPHMIPNDEAVGFMERALAGDFDWGKPAGFFKAGMKVRFQSGPFARMKGIIISCREDGKGDAVIEVDMFGSRLPVLAPLAFLEKV
ncbi:hypothetical protein AKG11_03535 [Shinella sp. SUS2]|uniref:transcription termination/antitermination protein NusG n=1 Tax=unclassified Shinella TaxID=2643062 RepID=UPI0006A508C6|nr:MULTISPECIES: transcription termination/antitermination NusG family protein [unclassified Shinella]KNY18223.1 hypothetical protein AKG11_03535 [Shinella sp. SUS2]KOC77418.1 hypothetical protein AKG10_01005 [Shinella sp. GWS1]